MDAQEVNKEIEDRNKILERLKGYGCGYHKQLEKMILNQIKKLKRNFIDTHPIDIADFHRRCEKWLNQI